MPTIRAASFTPMTSGGFTGIPEHVVALIPQNPLASMVQREMLQIVLFSVIVGVAPVSISASRHSRFSSCSARCRRCASPLCALPYPADGDNVLLITDGAVVRASNGDGLNTFTSANGAPGNGAAVGPFRTASARFDGIIFFENSADGGGLAVQVADVSYFQVRSSSNALIRTIDGDVNIINNSAAEPSEVAVEGKIALELNPSLRISGFSRASGLVTLGDQSMVSFGKSSDFVEIDNDVACNDGTAGGVINLAV